MKGNDEWCPNPTISTPEPDNLVWSNVVSIPAETKGRLEEDTRAVRFDKKGV